MSNLTGHIKFIGTLKEGYQTNNFNHTTLYYFRNVGDGTFDIYDENDTNLIETISLRSFNKCFRMIEGVEIVSKYVMPEDLNESRINLRKIEYTPAEKFFQSVLDRTTGIKTDPRYRYSIYYYDPETNQINFELNNETRYFLVRWNNIWSKLESDFGLNKSAIQFLIKNMVEQHYNLTSVTPSREMIGNRATRWSNIMSD